MQYLKIDSNTKFVDLKNMVGSRNMSEMLAVNGLERRPDIGKQVAENYSAAISGVEEVGWQRKSTILNTLSDNSDLFELAALSGEAAWKVLSVLDVFPSMLKIPDGMTLPDSVSVVGNGQPVAKRVYTTVMEQITKPPHEIDPSSFNEYSSTKGRSIVQAENSAIDENFFQMFKVPWGEVTLYSSFGDKLDFPVYPENMEDGVNADYSQMPDLLYQYEPWLVYQSSGPRTVTYDFHMHRDMWTGSHLDGKCNELIRTCEAQCYPQYSGSAVHTSIVSLYIAGKCLISGVMTNVKTSWGGPILTDGWYGEVTLSISITEVSQTALNYESVKNKSLIG